MEDNPTSRAFRRRYVFAGCIAILLALPPFHPPDVAAAAQMASLVMWMAPLVKRGGLSNNLKLALASVSLNLVTSAWIVWSIFDYLYQLPSLEGPHGEGSPLAAMLAAFNMGLLWLVPWGLAWGSGMVACFTSDHNRLARKLPRNENSFPPSPQRDHEV